MWLDRHLGASGRWRALRVDLETAREQPDPAAAMRTVLETVVCDTNAILLLRHGAK
ncbi:MAG TPA: hypothetical protein VHN14_19870 [Kofleriaceae bacterium]|jgi:hypothetical protein|nr:hypothetical protein [Kofleriaceae bacterium]